MGDLTTLGGEQYEAGSWPALVHHALRDEVFFFSAHMFEEVPEEGWISQGRDNYLYIFIQMK